jgi:hypothetical protein
MSAEMTLVTTVTVAKQWIRKNLSAKVLVVKIDGFSLPNFILNGIHFQRMYSLTTIDHVEGLLAGHCTSWPETHLVVLTGGYNVRIYRTRRAEPVPIDVFPGEFEQETFNERYAHLIEGSKERTRS